MSDPLFVLDASALLAAIFNEPGDGRVADVIGQSVVSTINLSEVVARLQDKGFLDLTADEVLGDLDITTVPFDAELAVTAGRLRAATRHAGLSLGDRACIALGRRLGATVLTADRAWATMDLGVEVELIR